MRSCFSTILFILSWSYVAAQGTISGRLIDVDSGWAGNSINTVVFRKNSLTSFGDTQFVAFYNKDQFVVLGMRRIGSTRWQLLQTNYKADASDAHNSISIIVDGKGYLHLSWGQHNTILQYCKSVSPGSLIMSDKILMVGSREDRVTYPEFYRFPNGDLLFLYRDGSSGNGNLVMNRYGVSTGKWIRLHDNLIDGEGKRNAYWQAYIDGKSTIHLSWIWRESPDVASNHDMCYARSTDGGRSWENSEGKKYSLPVTLNTAEYAIHIPQHSELINQTSMSADDQGNPYIATYWRDSLSGIPQYHIIYKHAGHWRAESLGFRKTLFSLSGAGTKRIPIARPQIIIGNDHPLPGIAVFFRDEERNNRVSVAIKKAGARMEWELHDLFPHSLGKWEPTYDPELWRDKHRIHLFVQTVEQRDAEGMADVPPAMIRVLEWKPYF